eukprot:scaffold108996_cov66-Attheya_sp.AAC.3
MVFAVVQALGWYDGRKPASTLYIPKFKPAKRNAKVTKNDVDPRTKMNLTRWVIYEHPTAIELVDGPDDCDPITCLEALKYTQLSLTADVNEDVVLQEVDHEYYCPLTFHYLGQMLKDCIYGNILDYSMIGVDTNDDKAVSDILGYRMKIVARDLTMDGEFNHTRIYARPKCVYFAVKIYGT